jgi:hypothetical protein
MTRKLRPIEHLPMPKPCDYDPGPKFFYENFVSPITEDMIKMMCTGMHIDEDAVESLRSTIDEVLSSVDARLLRNPIIQKYQAQRQVEAQKAHYAKSTEAIRTPEDFYRPYNGSVIHRSWVVNTYLKSIGAEKDCKESWTVKSLKSYNVFKGDRTLEKIVDKSITEDSPVLKAGMQALAEFKTELWNRPRYDKANAKASLDPFNPGSAKQKQELFEMLNIEPFEVSDKTGDGSWGRDHIEALLKQSDGSDKDLEEVLECIIDHSFSGIIRSTFLKAFDTFTIDGVLHGNIRVFGAKSFRPTSNSPNLNDTKRNSSKTSVDDNKQTIDRCLESNVLLALQGFMRVISCLKYPKRGNSLIRNVTQCTIVHTQTFQRTIPC